jgi:hypothetical protein
MTPRKNSRHSGERERVWGSLSGAGLLHVANERQRVSHAIEVSRRSGERECVWGV